MKRRVKYSFFLILGIASLSLSSCSKPFDTIKNKTWEGQIYRTNDNKLLSDTRLKFSNDTLFLFANAIFGALNDTLLQTSVNDKDSILTYLSKQGEVFQFKIEHKLFNTIESLYLNGNDFYIVLGNCNLDINDANALDFYKNYEVPRNALMYLDGTYQGEMEMDNYLVDMFLANMGGITFQIDFLDDFKVRMKARAPIINIFGGSTPKPEVLRYKVVGNNLLIGEKNGYTINVQNNGLTLVYEYDGKRIVLHKVY